jgi:hypothetical protein
VKLEIELQAGGRVVPARIEKKLAGHYDLLVELARDYQGPGLIGGNLRHGYGWMEEFKKLGKAI